MADGETTSNSATAVAEPPAQAAGSSAPVETGTPSQSGPATTQAQSAPVEEQFSNIDPKTLSPEMQAIYKNLQADYTKKTQSIAEAKKKADYYDQLSKDQRFVDYWNGLNRQQKADLKKQEPEVVKKLAERISPEEFQKAFSSPEEFMAFLEKANKYASESYQKKIDQLEAQLSVKDAADVVESFATQMKDGQLVRPDFYQLDEDGLITGYLSVNQPEDTTEKAYQQKLNEAYTWAKGMTQKYYEKGRQEALTRIQQKATTSTEPPTGSAKGAYTGPDPKKLTAGDAIALAKKGIRVPRDD